MDRTVRIAIIVACVAVTVAAIVVTTLLVSRTFEDRPRVQDRPVVDSAKSEDTTPTDPNVFASEPSTLKDACEAAQLKLLKGEVTDPGERLSLNANIDRYCKDKTSP
jgi:hypothetical protein